MTTTTTDDETRGQAGVALQWRYSGHAALMNRVSDGTLRSTTSPMRRPYREPIETRHPDWERAGRAELEGMLQPDEELLWLGRPRQGLRFAPQDAIQVPFGLLWGGFAMFWEAMALLHAPLIFALWGIPFVAMGVYLVAGRFFVDRARRARTYYGLTSQRALIVKAGRRRSTLSIDLATVQAIDFREGGYGRGTLRFGPPQWDPPNPSRSWPGARVMPSFEDIEDARAVYKTLLAAQRAIREPDATRRPVVPLIRADPLDGDELGGSADEAGAKTRL